MRDKPNFFIRYKGKYSDNDSEIDLAQFGESIIGFSSILEDLFKSTKLNGEISVNATKTSEGSLVVDIVLKILSGVQNIPFNEISDFLNFLKVVDESLWRNADLYFNAIDSGHRTINDYFKENPFDLSILELLLSGFFGIMIGRVSKHKKQPDLEDLPKDYAVSLHKMIRKGKFKRAVKPFIYDEVKKIEVCHDKDFPVELTTMINSDNFENYLDEKEMILPEYIDGKMYEFTGTLVGIQCSKGDSMKIKVHGFPRKFQNLVALPPADQSTKDFDHFYGELVLIKAYILRDSLYQKPKLRIEEMRLLQEPLI